MHIGPFRALTWIAVLHLLFSSSAMQSEEAAPEWPKVLWSGGATESADLSEWQPRNPADYSGHYVCGSVTDGWVDWRVTVHQESAGADAPWVVDVYQHDGRLDPDKRDTDFKKRPFHGGSHAWIQLAEGGPMFFFARYSTLDQKKKPWSKPVLAGQNGDYYVYEAVPPQFLLLEGRETPLKFEPWIAKDPMSYEGTYVCQSLAKGKGSREVEIGVKHDPKQRVPWRVDFSNTEEGTDTKYPDYEYSDCPLWQETWPHFDAYGTFLCVIFTDPRKPEPKAEGALISERGEVFVRKAEESEKGKVKSEKGE